MPPESCNFNEAEERQVRQFLRSVIDGHENMKVPYSDQSSLCRHTQSSPRAPLRMSTGSSAGRKKRGRDGNEKMRDTQKQKLDVDNDAIEDY